MNSLPDIHETENFQTIDHIRFDQIKITEIASTQVISKATSTTETGFFFHTDSSVLFHDISNASTTVVYKCLPTTSILALKYHWKIGPIILLANEELNSIIQIENWKNKQHLNERKIVDIRSNNGGQIISEFDISPNGEYLAINYEGYESYDSQIISFIDLSVFKELPQFNQFVKWIEGNTFFAISHGGVDLGDLKIYQINLNTKRQIMIESPMTELVDYKTSNGKVIIHGRKLIPPHHFKDTIINVTQSLAFSSLRNGLVTTDGIVTANYSRGKSNTFNLLVTENTSNDTILNKNYKLEYPHMNRFDFNQINIDSAKNINIEFRVTHGFYPYGYVVYNILPDGDIESKNYQNIFETNKGKDNIKFQIISDSTHNMVVKYINEIQVSVERHSIVLPPIPRSIHYNQSTQPL